MASDKIQAQQSNPVLVVTNPLHFEYVALESDVRLIASLQGPVPLFEFNVSDRIEYFDCPNTIQALVASASAIPKYNDAAYVVWKPLDTRLPILGNRFDDVSVLERKAFIREQLPTDLFPPYTIIRPGDPIRIDELKAMLGSEKVVIQVDYSTGGMGTFIVDSAEAWEACKHRADLGQPLVVSAFADGVPRAIQCYFDGQAAYHTGLWNKDLVGINGVIHPTQFSTQYSGAILETMPAYADEKFKIISAEVISVLDSVGFRGVFGMDIIANDEDKTISLVEINPRFTAVSSLYAAAMRARGLDVDFMTLDIMNRLGNNVSMPEKHTVTLSDPLFYLKLQNTANEDKIVSTQIRYGLLNGDNEFIEQKLSLARLGQKELCILPEVAAGAFVKPGKRVFSIIGQGDPTILGGGAMLQNNVRERIDRVRSDFLRDA